MNYIYKIKVKDNEIVSGTDYSVHPAKTPKCLPAKSWLNGKWGLFLYLVFVFERIVKRVIVFFSIKDISIHIISTKKLENTVQYIHIEPPTHVAF